MYESGENSLAPHFGASAQSKPSSSFQRAHLLTLSASQNSHPIMTYIPQPLRILRAHLDPIHASRNIQTHLLNLTQPPETAMHNSDKE